MRRRRRHDGRKVSYVKGDYTRGVYREGIGPALEVPQQRPGAVDRPPPRGADVVGDVLREVAVRVENALASGFRIGAVRAPAGTRPRDVLRAAVLPNAGELTGI